MHVLYKNFSEIFSEMGRKTQDTSIEIRKLVIKHHENGKSYREISNIVNRSRSTVQYIVKRHKIHHRIENMPRNLNRRKLTDHDERKILREVKKNPRISAPKLATKVECEMGKKVSSSTIRRTLKKFNYNGRVARKKPFVSQANKCKRLEFANKYLKYTHTFWKRVIFTDESKFNVFQSDGRQIVWRRPNTSLDKENLQATVKYGGGSVMV